MEVISYESLDKVLNKISEYYDTNQKECSIPTQYLDELFNLKTLFTDETVVGHWNPAIQGGTWSRIYICSNCGEWSNTKECVCPNCNSHMY